MKLEPTSLRYIAIEGVLGAGKTTLATMLAQRLNAQLVLEHFEDNPFLVSFYQDPERFAFQTQLFFLLSRFKQQQTYSQMDLFQSCIVTDYVFERDRIFATVTLNESELKLYDQVAQVVERSVPQPDLIVYLQSSVERLEHNIHLRGRTMEAQVTQTYLGALNREYNNFFFRFSEAPVLIVNAAEIDFEHNEEQFEELVHEITRPRTAQIQYYLPMQRP